MSDSQYVQASSHEQRLAELPHSVSQESDKSDEVRFQVEPHSSEYVAGVDPKKLKDKLNELDDETFIRNSSE